MPVRTIQGTLDTFSVNAGSEITYEGPTRAGDKGLNIRGFKVNPANTGNLTVTIDRSSGVQSIEIFQESDYSAGAAPAGYQRILSVKLERAVEQSELQWLMRLRTTLFY
jgi:hypothetical protein